MNEMHFLLKFLVMQYEMLKEQERNIGKLETWLIERWIYGYCGDSTIIEVEINTTVLNNYELSSQGSVFVFHANAKWKNDLEEARKKLWDCGLILSEPLPRHGGRLTFRINKK